MEKFVNFLSKACVSVWGLVIFNLLVLTINVRVLWWIGFIPHDIQQMNMSDFYGLANSLGVRLVTVGVLILERQDVLELAGIIPKGSDHDEITERTHPFGMFYLCFGLVMECLIEQIDLPGKLFDVTIINDAIVWGVYIIAVISLLANLKLCQVLLVHGLLGHSKDASAEHSKTRSHR